MARNNYEFVKQYTRKKHEIARGRVIRHIGFKIILVRRPGCSQTFAVAPGQGNRSFAPGTSLNLINMQGSGQIVAATLPPTGRTGVSAYPVRESEVGELDGCKIISADPDEVDAGSLGLDIVLEGFGFIEDPADILDAVIYNPITDEYSADPFVTINSYTWQDENHILINIDASEDTPDNYFPDIRLRRG